MVRGGRWAAILRRRAVRACGPLGLLDDKLVGLMELLYRRVAFLVMVVIAAVCLGACPNQDHVVKTPVPPAPKQMN